MALDAHTKWTLAMWLTLPPTALHYAHVENQLPQRAESLHVGLWSYVVAVVVFTLVNFLVRWQRPDRAGKALVLSWVVLLFVCVVHNAVL